MSEKVIAHFKMTRAVIDDAETAALEAAGAHAFQLDGLSKQVTALTQENGELALEAARLRKRVDDVIQQAGVDVADARTASSELFQTTQRLRSEREAAVAELAHVREQLASTLCVIEQATAEAESAVVYANVDTSLSDPRAGKLLVVRLSVDDANSLAHKPLTAIFWTEQFVGWLEAAQDEGDTETTPYTGAEIVIAGHVVPSVDVHHAGMPTPVVRCGECTAHKGHFGDCVKAVQP